MEQTQERRQTLDEFLDKWHEWPANAWVDEKGFSGLYVRRGRLSVIINGIFCWCEPCLTIAAVESEKPGNGAFTKLINRLKKQHLAIYVENVHNPVLQRKLLKMGFVQVNRNSGTHFLANFRGRLRRMQ